MGVSVKDGRLTAEDIFGVPGVDFAELAREVLKERARREAKRLIDLEAQADQLPASPLEFTRFADLAREVDSAGPAPWMLVGFWPSGDYGIHAAEMKAQKTWNATDMAVSVASRTPWLGYVAVEDAGPVLMFVGEGGKRNIVRRIRAIAEPRGIDGDTLPIVICARAPHLGSGLHLDAIEAQIRHLQPKLVIIDPLYLSAKGAGLADLYAMGALLESIQRICQRYGTSLLIVTHHNRKEGRGAGRITGAGPAEWGRVLLNATVKSRRTDPVTKATDVITEIDAIGGEIPDQTLRVHRRVWADDPTDLNSPLHVTTAVMDGSSDDVGAELQESAPKLTPAAQKLLEALRAKHPATNGELVDRVAAAHGHGLRRETVSRTMRDLERAGYAYVVADAGRPGASTLWGLSEGCDQAVRDCDRVTPPIRGAITSRTREITRDVTQITQGADL